MTKLETALAAIATIREHGLSVADLVAAETAVALRNNAEENGRTVEEETQELLDELATDHEFAAETAAKEMAVHEALALLAGLS